MALAGHVAAERDERGGAEPELLRPEQRGDQEVASGLQAAVGADHDAIAQPVPQERLVHLGKAELPRDAGVLDRAQRARPRPPAVPGDVDVIGACLGDPGSDRANAARGNELHADPGAGVDRAEVGDQLRQVLDGVDVVVRRRADERLARTRAAE